jgi:hypothetical protein
MAEKATAHFPGREGQEGEKIVGGTTDDTDFTDDLWTG